MPTLPNKPLAARIAAQTQLGEAAVAAAVELFGEGCTVPFIARYRKERTHGLDEVQLFAIEAERTRLVDLDARRDTIRAGIIEAGGMNPALERALTNADTRSELEDLWLPFKKKRRTRAMMARERGLEPLANLILGQSSRGRPEVEAARFVTRDDAVPTIADALSGARDIVAEVMAETSTIRSAARDAFVRHARLTTTAVKKTTTGVRTPFEDLYSWDERLDRAPSHRILAALRGEREGFIRVALVLDDDRLLRDFARIMRVQPSSPWANELLAAIQDGYTRLLRPSIDNEIRGLLKERADVDAVAIFAQNLDAMLLAAPLGQVPIIAMDPGLRTGAKVVVLSALGELLAHTVIFPITRDAEARKTLVELTTRHGVKAIAIGNGTGGRETSAFARQCLKDQGLSTVQVVEVNESGASIYSASEVAREEFPDLDLTWRGAISIGRRLQDPLSELVKLDPKSLGAGQYQHDVDQGLLQRALEETVEIAVNRVGVDVNTASPHLLRRVAGIGPTLATSIVEHRRQHGAFKSRRALLDVKGLGRQRFLQAAGFLRIRGGENPLDASAVHPERYDLVERIARDIGLAVGQLVGNAEATRRIEPLRYIDDEVGEPTIRDICGELDKPGRDPRSNFTAPAFRDDVHTLSDLHTDMVLGGVVTNVTAFGAFVDIGVHQDGLVHVSALADRFVRDPHEIVKAGQHVRVRVVSLDLERKRVGLTMKGLAQA